MWTKKGIRVRQGTKSRGQDFSLFSLHISFITGCIVVIWRNLCEVILFWSEVKWSEVKWVTVKFLGIKVPCTLGWPYTEGTWLYCDYFEYVLYCICFNLYCGCCNLFCNVWVFGNTCVLVFTVFCIVCTVFFVLFRLCFVCTSVRTTATERQLNGSWYWQQQQQQQ